MAKTETAEGFQSPAPISLLDSLSGLIKNNNLALADSLYSVLLSDADYDTSISLFLLGLELRLNEGFNKNCSDLLEEILNRTKKGSSSQKTAIGLYDKSIETYLIEAKSLENRGKYTEAATILEKMEPYRLIPASTARGNLHLQYSSVLLATNNPESADSLLKLYLAAGYRKSPAYKNIADRLAIVKKHKTAHAEIKTTRPDDILEEKPQSKSDQYIMMSPPQGDIIKVLVGSIDPMTGQIKETKLWETTGPLKMKTGAAYTLTVQRKHERKASLFIAAAGIVATFFIVR
jgi:tetratricopeptide (TPR) repeat protein